MNLKKIVAGICLTLILHNMDAYAYSYDKLDEIEDELELETPTFSYASEEEKEYMEGYDQYVRIQKISYYLTSNAYKRMIDHSNIPSKTIKKIMKTCVDDTMCDSAKESIIYINIADSEEEILANIMEFFESRDNDYAYESGSLRDTYDLEYINILDNRKSVIKDIPENLLLFKDYSSYDDYRIYIYYDFDNDSKYQIITNEENKILFILTEIYSDLMQYEYSYDYLEDQDIYINSLITFCINNDLYDKLKSEYTYEELEDIEKIGIKPKIRLKQLKIKGTE